MKHLQLPRETLCSIADVQQHQAVNNGVEVAQRSHKSEQALSHSVHCPHVYYLHHQTFSLRVRRAPRDSLRAVVVSDVMTSIQSICDQRSLQCCVERVHDAEAVQCSPAIVQGLTAAVEASEQVQQLVEDTSCLSCST